MDINLLPDSERRALLAEENKEELTYPVIEFRGYYARISVFAGLGELFLLRSTKQGSEDYVIHGVVTSNSKESNISLLLLYRAVDVEKQPFVAARLDTEFFKAEKV